MGQYPPGLAGDGTYTIAYMISRYHITIWRVYGWSPLHPLPACLTLPDPTSWLEGARKASSLAGDETVYSMALTEIDQAIERAASDGFSG